MKYGIGFYIHLNPFHLVDSQTAGVINQIVLDQLY